MVFSQELQAVTDQMKRDTPPEIWDLLEDFISELKESGMEQKALKPGDEIPPFVLPDATGKLVSSSELLMRGPLVISFYRGSWCPWCNLELKTLQDHLKDIHYYGAKLVAISPMTPDNSLTFSEKLNLEFEVLSDAGNKVADEFGLVFNLSPQISEFFAVAGIDLPNLNSDESWSLPMPATYVVDTDGVVISAVNADWKNRLDPLEIIAALQKLG